MLRIDKVIAMRLVYYFFWTVYIHCVCIKKVPLIYFAVTFTNVD